MKHLFDKITANYKLSDVDYQRDNLAFVTVKKENAVDLITYLKDFEGFNHLVLISCVDWIEEGVFQLTYFLNHPDKKYDLAVRTLIARDNAEMVSCHHLWKQVETYQRELREMYGISFPGSPRVNENFILEGWDDVPPMRREFDTMKYSEETFAFREGRATNDPARYMQKKLYPDSSESVQGKKNEE